MNSERRRRPTAKNGAAVRPKKTAAVVFRNIRIWRRKAMMHRNIGDLLNRRRVVSLPAGASVRDAARQMKAAHVASVVVIASIDEQIEGIFTERDLTDRVVADGLDPDQTRLSEVMTPCPVTAAHDITVGEALRRMVDHGLRHLPVVRDGRVIGVLSMRDFLGEELMLIEHEREMMDSLTEVMM
ncbi:CBS domain-containing protein [Azospirillum brasilense]|uniref:CBS domain-containing protein n=2 Tax=Azospirillum brasilense TaxID=192 RepID=A0A4D8QWJ0_AZOBR|nr:CBS domain-containing protein [Azospirillum brasilense]